jgi:hypothetical protein
MLSVMKIVMSASNKILQTLSAKSYLVGFQDNEILRSVTAKLIGDEIDYQTRTTKN